MGRVKKGQVNNAPSRFTKAHALIVGLLGSVLVLLQIIYLLLGGLPNLSLILVQDGTPLGQTSTRLIFPQKVVKTEPLTVTVDESKGPEVISNCIEGILLMSQVNIVCGLMPSVRASPLHRDQIIRLILERTKQLVDSLGQYEPEISYTIQIGNSRSRSVLSHGEIRFESQMEGGSNIVIESRILLDPSSEIDEGKSRLVAIPIRVPVDDVIDLNQLATESWNTFMAQSPIARTNFVPFLNYVGQTSGENISQVLAKAPLFAHPDVFGPYVSEFRRNYLHRLLKARIHMSVTLWDIHGNKYIFDSPIKIDVKPAGYSEDAWVKVVGNSIRACRDMHQRVLDLGLSWEEALRFFSGGVSQTKGAKQYKQRNSCSRNN